MSQDKLLVYIIAFISLIAIISFLSSPYFQVRNISYQGLEALKKSELEEILKTYYRRNILLIDKSEVRARLLKLSYIKEVTVIKNPPDKLEIVIEERVPLAKINNNGKYLVFSEKGYILEKGSLKTRSRVPEILGTGYSLANNRVLFSPLLEEIVQALKEINRETREMIASIQADKGEINLGLYSQVPIYLGSSKDLVKKFRILQSVLTKVRKEDLKVEYIDLSIFQKPVIKLGK